MNEEGCKSGSNFKVGRSWLYQCLPFNESNQKMYSLTHVPWHYRFWIIARTTVQQWELWELKSTFVRFCSKWSQNVKRQITPTIFFLIHFDSKCIRKKMVGVSQLKGHVLITGKRLIFLWAYRFCFVFCFFCLFVFYKS